MMPYLHDITWWLYILMILSALWGFGLFSWWWYKTVKESGERPSSMYMCFWLMFLGTLINSCISLYMRTHVVSLGFSSTFSFFSHWAWSARVLPETIAMMAVDFIMTYRIVFKKHLFKANGTHSIIVSDGKIGHAAIEDAKAEKVIIHGDKIKEVILKDAKVKVAVIIDAIVKEIER